MESHNCIKSLKDTLLEYAVLNMDLLFSHDTIPIFPNCLFEDILEKSKDYWPILKIDLIPCIVSRDKLRWSDTSCFRFVENFSTKELETYRMRISKTLKLDLVLKEPSDKTFFKEIMKVSETVEDLSLTIVVVDTFKENYMADSGSAYSEEIEAMTVTCTPLKLKRLRLKVKLFELFPYTLDSDKLTVLDLSKCTLSKYFLKTLVGFRQLTYLSFWGSMLDDVSIQEVIDAVICLKSLRFLNLFIPKISMDELTISKIVNEMEYLDMLEVKRIKFRQPNRLLAHKRKLKALNCLKLSFSEDFTRLNIDRNTEITGLAHRIGRVNNLEGLMTIISTTPTKKLYFYAVGRLFDLINDRNVDHKGLIEAEKKEILNFRSHWRLNETFCSVPYTGTSYNLILRMVCYVLNRYGLLKYPILEEWIRDFVEHNENTHLAKRFLRVQDIFK